jgi:hypothetical protein
MSQKFEFVLFADYFQFYLQDESVKGDLSESWTQEAVDRLLAIAPGTIGVGTVRNMNVPVVVEVNDNEPESNDAGDWDQVNECSMEVPSGRIVVAGCTDYFPDAARINVAPGWYRARIHYGDLDSLSTNGLEDNDHYRLVIWRAEPGPVKILKARVTQAKN